MSTSVSQLAHETFKKMVAEGFTPIKCEVIGHKPSAQDLSQLREESHEAARDLLQEYEIEDSMIATSVELVDVLSVSVPRAVPVVETEEPDVTPSFVPVVPEHGRTPSANHVLLIQPANGLMFAGRLQTSGRVLWTHHTQFATPVPSEDLTFYSRLFQEQGVVIIPLWSEGV